MALSTKKRNQIIADIKSGRFDSVKSLCTHYKISNKTYYRIKEKVHTSNVDVVELGVAYETSKKVIKKSHEIASIEKTVAERIITIEADNQIIANNRKLLQAMQGKVAKSLKEDELKPQDIKALSGVVKDAESVANPQSNKVEVNNQINNQINEIRVVFE